MVVSQPERFGALLRRWRTAAGLTQEELAEQAGLSARGISDLERGLHLPQRATVRLLAASLGLDDGAAAILARAARGTVEVSSEVSSRTGSATFPPLMGRIAELEFLTEHLGRGDVPLLVLSGEPGIGKSRLLQEAGQMGEDTGFTVLAGGCQRRSAQEPYAPIAQALAAHVARLSPRQLQTALHGCSWLARLLPELTEMIRKPWPVGEGDSGQARRLMFGAVARFLANIAGPRGTLLLLDDLQWAGADALDLLAALARDAPNAGIRMVAGYRDTDIAATPHLQELLADLGKEGRMRLLQLGPLDPAASQALLDQFLQSPSASEKALSDGILQRAGGVPFFLVSCAHWLVMDSDVAVQGLPWNVAQSIRQRVAALNDEARMVVQAAAVVGRMVPRSTLVAALGSPEQKVLNGLDAACRARLLLPEGRQAYRFAHDVVRESIEADLGEAQRVLLHRRVGEVLETLPESERRARVAELAWHFLEGDDPSRALLHAIEAGDQAQAVFAHEEAERQYQMAGQLAGDVHNECREAEALEKLGTLYWMLGRYSEALTELEAAAGLYERLSDLSAIGRVAGKIGWTHCHRGTGEEGIHHLQALAGRLEELGPTTALVDIYDSLVPLYWRHGDSEMTRVAAERTADLANALADEKARVRGELNRGLVLWGQDRLEDARQVLEDVIPRAEQVHDPESVFRALAWTANVYADMGQFQRARSYLERAVEVTERAASPSFHTSALDWLAELLFGLGNWREAREHWERAIAVEPHITGWAGGDAHVGLARLALTEGKREEVAAHLQEAHAIFRRTGWPTQDRRPGLPCVLAQQDLLEGRPGAALARLDRVALESRLRSHTGAHERQVLAEAALELGELVRATALVEEGVRATQASGHQLVLMDWLRLQGMLLTRAARWEEARAVLEEGLALARDMPHPYQAGRILFEIGRMHAAKREEAPARASLKEALAVFLGLGARPFLERTEEALRGLP